MQEKETIMAVRCELKITSLAITIRHYSASLLMLNSYSCDGIFNFNSHLTTIKDSYILLLSKVLFVCSHIIFKIMLVE